ncbi:hypothetical protein XFF6990_60035 [Xanthomonas citri pv. fuscans]|uniref:Uncharacterized protein n=1 Tax=Xanthomonas campestris pv. phaseoli TaxID=317013 RepID=A0A7Z7J0K6_XANCH|nr:hypothetical protein XFF6990_60035 [Xanthomonas citri pv. fuscans]SOO25029.1 hypothetical protein XFF6991_420246 [Xanthomonas phaseoli pv. phaseoli]
MTCALNGGPGAASVYLNMGAIGPRSSVSAPKAKARRHLQARKYLVGERYGGFRGPRIPHYLQAQLGVAMNGVVLVSPYLNPTLATTAMCRHWHGCCAPGAPGPAQRQRDAPGDPRHPRQPRWRTS